MAFQVLLTEDAERDLSDLYDYISSHDSPAHADFVLDSIEGAVMGLRKYPERGSYPSELEALGIKEFREVYFKPYRIIYRVIGKKVYVFLIADGRRDMRRLLERRITAPM